MRLVHLFCLIIVVGTMQTIVADTVVSENRVREIAHKLRCPTCQGLSVKESEAGIAENMKTKIRSLLHEGKSEEEILQYFVVRYGEWILRSPKKEGFNLLLWITPGALIILAAGVIVFRALVKNDEEKHDQEISPLTEKEQQEIDREIQKLERS